jgi:hypothetical protein
VHPNHHLLGNQWKCQPRSQIPGICPMRDVCGKANNSEIKQLLFRQRVVKITLTSSKGIHFKWMPEETNHTLPVANIFLLFWNPTSPSKNAKKVLNPHLISVFVLFQPTLQSHNLTLVSRYSYCRSSVTHKYMSVIYGGRWCAHSFGIGLVECIFGERSPQALLLSLHHDVVSHIIFIQR